MLHKVFLALTFLALISGTSAYCQETETVGDEKVYTDIEVHPEFPGGMKAFYEFVGKNYKVPLRFSGSGQIITQFIIEKDGTLSDIKVLKDPGYGTGKAAIKTLKKSPKWKPGIQNGKPVRVLYSLPIKISLDK